MEIFYQKVLSFIRNHHDLEIIMIFIIQYFPYIPFIIYPCVLFYLFITKHSLFLVTLLKPLIAFLFVTIFRKIVNRPRPYESMDIQPLVGHKKGESFPSRHAVSAMIIALVCLDIHVLLGMILLVVAIIICISRIIAGIHYVSDVCVSIGIAVIIYLIQFF